MSCDQCEHYKIDFNFCPNCGEPLTPPEPLTLEQLREMDGEPVYVQLGDGPEGYAIIVWEDRTLFLYGPSFDDYAEPDLVFINLEFDDPDGHFGLHVLGWRAYTHKPKEDGK